MDLKKKLEQNRIADSVKKRNAEALKSLEERIRAERESSVHVVRTAVYELSEEIRKMVLGGESIKYDTHLRRNIDNIPFTACSDAGEKFKRVIRKMGFRDNEFLSYAYGIRECGIGVYLRFPDDREILDEINNRPKASGKTTNRYEFPAEVVKSGFPSCFDLFGFRSQCKE